MAPGGGPAGSLSGLKPFPDPYLLKDAAGDDLLRSHIEEGTIVYLDGLADVLKMFSEDDAHHLKEAADVAKAGRLKALSAARSFGKAADLMRSYELRHDIKSHLESCDFDAATQNWEHQGYIQSGAKGAFQTLANAARQADLAALVAGFAAKLEILAQQLAWPVENLLSNRFAHRGDMMQVFSTVAQLISEAGWLSNFFYAMPSAPREEHMKWLDTLDEAGVPKAKR